MKSVIKRFMESRPECKAIIGYGSGIHKQAGMGDRKAQVDLIVVVDNLKKWHQENAIKNPSDYSFTGKNFMTKCPVTWLKKGGRICYMTYIPFEGHSFKIGTIEQSDFLDSLNTWDTFYLAGRMQKPILIVKSNKTIDNAIIKNRNMAIISAILISDERKIPMEEFYETIVSLSYIGDTRMKFAENPKKVSNIVKGSLEFFELVYGKSPFLNREKGYIKNKHSKAMIKELPILVQSSIAKASSPKEGIINYLTSCNKDESLNQTVKGIFTSGPVKSIVYASAKLKRAKGK
jgi:translocator assembly and maintenance protein 41